MLPPPPGWPRISSALYYEDPAAAIDWLVQAFGFEVRLRVEGEDGSIEHSELCFGEGLIMVGGTQHRRDGDRGRSPRALGGANTQCLCICVPDADAHCAHARAHGAIIQYEPKTTDYGDDYWADRSYAALDPEGHVWWFMQRMRTGAGHG